MTDHRTIEHKTMTPEALFHRAIKTHLNKRQQGLVMGAYRDVQLIAQPKGKVQVSLEPLLQLLRALHGAPHLIRELQATLSPSELFPANPINVLVKELEAGL